RRADGVRRAPDPELPGAGLARAVPHPVIHRVVPRLRHATRLRLSPALVAGAPVPRPGALVAQGSRASPRAGRVADDLPGRASRRAPPGSGPNGGVERE